MIKTKLFDGQLTTVQQLIISLWLILLGCVLLVWGTTAEFTTLPRVLDAFGMLFGLLATYCALTQFMLMGRVAWVERSFGLEHLASFHRLNGYAAISFLLVHPIFITVSYALGAHIGLWRQYTELIRFYDFVWLALIGELLFIAVAFSSLYIVRKRLKFETWYYVHLMVYAAIVFTSLHQFRVSDSFSGEHPLATSFWLGLYIFVALNVLIWRFGLPVYNWLRFGFRIDRVVAETPTTTSLYIRGRRLNRWHSKPGQFVLLRIFAKGMWWQEHPFSLSWIPHDNCLRVTIRHVGDYTREVANLQPGTHVLVSGPYGRFTRAVATTNKRLYVAGGVGITPLRSMIEEAVKTKTDSVLLYANRTPDDVVFAKELASFSGQYLKIIEFYSEPPKRFRGNTGYVDVDVLRRYVSDFAERDVYVCGPPPMMTNLIDGLSKTSIDPTQLHYERFALHN
jgi:predicted ferric reductase